MYVCMYVCKYVYIYVCMYVSMKVIYLSFVVNIIMLEKTIKH